MIFVFSGNDIEKRQKALNFFLEKSGEEVLRFDETNISLESMNSLAENGDLFSKKYCVVVNQIFDTSIGKDVFLKLDLFKKSLNTFVFVENDLTKPQENALKKVAEEIKTFDTQEKKSEKFNIFSITDAFGERNKKKTWVLAQKAIKNNVSWEDILNILIWQTKNLLLVKGESNAKNTGLSPFVFQKSNEYSKNFTEEELKNLSRQFVTFFHESHLGLTTPSNIESFILKTL